MAELTTCMEKDADGAVPTSIIVPESCHRSSTALGQSYLVGERECEGNPCKRKNVRKLLKISNRQVW